MLEELVLILLLLGAGVGGGGMIEEAGRRKLGT